VNALCEFRIPGVCTGRAAHTHHRKMRSHGLDNSPANLAKVCLECHAWAHAHPTAAYKAGWLVRGVR
jgi:hypothetical protein